MLASSLLTVLLGAGALAVPMNKRSSVELTTVVETDIYDQNGHLVDKKFKVEAPKLQGGSAPAAPAAQPAANPAPQPQQAEKPKQPAANPAPQAPGKPINEISGAQATEQALHVGWVDNTDPIFGIIATYHHNVHRANHSAGPVTYDPELAQAAQDWANKCVGDEIIPPGSGYGMNVAFSSSPDGYNPSQFISGGWYNSEVQNFPGYGQNNLNVGGNFNSWGHFSQVVWPDTQKIGCGIAKCPGSGFAVHAGCMYYPAGNMLGEFAKVQPPKGQAVVLPNGQNNA